MHYNQLGQPIGEPVENWIPPQTPKQEVLEGVFSRLEPLSAVEHAEPLFHAFSESSGEGLWTYLPYGPFYDLAAYEDWLSNWASGTDPLLFAICERRSGRPLGVAGYLRIAPAQGSLEVGHLCFSASLQRSVIATEAMFLMMRQAFELGFRRYEWKCDALNQPSRSAAQRLGFEYEGTFRQAAVNKGRNRDTAWFSILDQDWPQLKEAYERWLHPKNMSAEGRQTNALGAFIQAARNPNS